MSKQEDYGSKKFFSTTEILTVVVSAVSFLADLVTAASFLFGSTSFIRSSPPKPTSFHLALVILLFIFVFTGLTFLIGALAQRYKRLNEDELKWKYEVEKRPYPSYKPYTYRKRQIRLRRSSQEVERLVYEEIEELGSVAGWIGVLPYIAWSTFTGSIIRAALVEMTGDPSLGGFGTLIVVTTIILALAFYVIPLEIAKSIVRSLFDVL